jgi:uncharacterized membrane protein YjfL (UPF0719 family)
MDHLEDIVAGIGAGLAFGVVGFVLLAIGYAVLDALTPGRLSQLIYDERNMNAAAVVGSAVVALSCIVTTAIATSDDELVEGLLDTAAYGLLGIALLALAFVVTDRLTPGRLGELVCAPGERVHPATVVTALSHLALGAVIAAAIA